MSGTTKWGKKKRRQIAVNAFLIILLCGTLTCIIYSVARLMNLYGIWEFETKICTLDLPKIDKPSFVTVTIKYVNKPPTDIKLKIDEKESNRIEFISNEENKTITFSFDTNRLECRYWLQMRPQDNYKLQYKVDIQPSYKFMTSNVEYYRDQAGDRWLKITADYEYQETPFYMMIQWEGQNYVPSCYDGTIDNHGTVILNVDEIARRKGLDLTKLPKMNIAISQQITDPDVIDQIESECVVQDFSSRMTSDTKLNRHYVNDYYSMKMDAWPSFDVSAKRDDGDFSLVQTNFYLQKAGIDSIMPDIKEPQEGDEEDE